MSQLAFFPWFTTKQDVSVGPVRLFRYERGRRPSSGAEQNAIDTILEAYGQVPSRPIGTGTIVSLDDRGLTDDFSSDQLVDLFRYGEAIALAGLSRRRFFDPLRYANRDNFRLIVQSFSEPGRGVLVTTRRRDGVTNTGFSRGTYHVLRDHHVSPGIYELDVGLMGAILASGSDKDWPRIFQSIILNNEANTDRDHLPDAAELVLSFAALEQLLDVQANPRALAKRFQNQWQPSTSLNKAEWQVTSSQPGVKARLMRAPTLRYAWVEDMGITRGSMAHGHDAQAYASIWTPREHLLFSAFVFPLLVKSNLVMRGHYTLTAEDMAGVDALEELLNARHFEDNDSGEQTPWSSILSKVRMQRWVLDAVEKTLNPDDTAS